jgi:hypothetical protein
MNCRAFNCDGLPMTAGLEKVVAMNRPVETGQCWARRVPANRWSCGRAWRGRLKLGLALVLAGGMGEIWVAADSWQYRLIEGSEWVDDCPACGRPTLSMPIRGQFTLELIEETPIGSRYEMRGVEFHTGMGTEWDLRLSGTGVFEMGGEVALRQEMRLELRVEGLGNAIHLTFTNEITTVSRPWPMLDISVNDISGTPLQSYRLVLRAAPIREIWFSTANGLTSGNSDPPFERISAGDLLAGDGRVVRSNSDLLGRLGFMPPTPEIGIDALEVQPGGEIWFSLNESMFSETLGLLQEGDLLSERGRVVKRNQELIAAFSFAGEPVDLGLDAVHVLPDGEIWFSLRTAAFSEALGLTVGTGDVLSERGYIVRSARELLAHFKPDRPEAEVGLDALYAWPSGEIWFSVESGFVSPTAGGIQRGDILSDQGFVVIRNLDLVQPFSPLEDLADFGLDGLWLVTDLALASEKGPTLALPSLQAEGELELNWDGPGRVFQVERASDPAGPYAPASPILPALQWRHQLESVVGQDFFRVRQW